jgi:hypothetical protein
VSGGARSSPLDPWRTLGLRPGASPDEVARAWRRAAAASHPDAGGDPERFRQVLAARDRLAALARSGTGAPVLVVAAPSRTAMLLRPIRRRIARRTRPRVT